MKTVVAVAFGAVFAALVVALTPVAHADPACFVNCQYDPSPSWNGQLMPTWDTPGTYGGWTSDPELCDPSSLQCRLVATP